MLDAESFAWANGLRRAHFPPERNQLDAHLTLFHALPPDAGPELKLRFIQATRGVTPLAATASRLMDLGGGTAIRIDCPALARVRDDLAAAFHGSLTRQDANGFRPHVTIQNKVDRATAVSLQQELGAAFRPRPVTITGLSAWAYEGGPWSPLFSSRFG